LLFPTLLAA